ncbi:MAG TPA: outer membrane beta-barrel protein [Spirochaetota bacterium]|nr:outer membrane beta-barrel protein [Spirochaetota bacterium]HRZ27679.1 outer membrane beta-barrel protein [Spirochaetota bacterium]HSA14324.1 outer membrane beta-barrel protein [Spirochaetota bacterium]
MRRFTRLTGVFVALMVFVFSASALQASTAKKFNLGVGGYLGMGAATTYGWSDHGAFAFGIEPEVQFFPIDNLSVTFRCLWERYFYVYDYGKKYDAPMDVIPFLFGVRFYFPTFIDKLKIYLGGGIGPAVLIHHYDIPHWKDDTDACFAMDFYGGVEYEVISQLAITGMFNTMLPNLEYDNGVIARFMFFFGVQYYIAL